MNKRNTQRQPAPSSVIRRKRKWRPKAPPRQKASGKYSETDSGKNLNSHEELSSVPTLTFSCHELNQIAMAELDNFAEKYRLSRRERDVLYLTCQGLPNRAVAMRLEVSTSAVRWHQRNIYRKTGVQDKVDLVLCIWRFGLLDQET